MLKKGQIDLTTAINLAKNKVMSSLNCHNIGKIITFYPDSQTADIEILQVKLFYNELFNLPMLVNIPVFIYGGANAGITPGNLEGATCILLFMDRNISSYLETGENYAPYSERTHDFSDCIALTTFKNDINALDDYDNEAINIYNKTSDSTSESTIKTYTNNINLYSTATIETDEGETTTSSNLNVNPDSVLLESSFGGQIEVANKINIENTQHNLNDLIQSLINACKNLVVDTNTGNVNAASQQVFTNLATQFGELLE